MSKRDSISHLSGVKATASGSPAVGAIIDTRGFDSVTLFAVLASAATLTWDVEHGDLANGSDMANCAESDLLRDPNAGSATVHKIGYVGEKRYIRANNAAAAILAVRCHAHQGPV